MGKLAGAYAPNGGGGSLPELKTKEAGEYRAYWIGMTDPVTEVSAFGDKCTMCKGAGTGRNGRPGECIRCNGSGTKTEQYVKLLYQLENGNIEEEKVSYKLSDSGTLKDGSPRSASKLFLRFRAFSQMPKAKAEDLDIWFSSLPAQIKVPVRVDIEWNGDATYLKIENVKYRPVAPPTGQTVQNGAAAPVQQQQVAQRAEARREPVGAGVGAQNGGGSDFAIDEFDDSELPF